MSPTRLKTRERLSEVRYEIRGELARRARQLEAGGRELIKLNLGNPGAFGFRAPEHLQRAIASSIADTDPYTHQQGLPAAREAIADFHRQRDTPDATPERVFIGNGVSELIDLSLRALLNPDDEVLLPSPDYPLWSAATILNDGRPVYYRCNPENDFLPDPAAADGFDDHAFALELLEEEGMIVPGSSFNVPWRNHFRVTLLPEAGVLRDVFARIDRVLARRAEARPVEACDARATAVA